MHDSSEIEPILHAKENTETQISSFFSRLFKRKDSTRGPSVLLYILVMIFGLSASINVNGIFAEVPIFITTLPERYKIPSYMAFAVQAGNAVPLAYMILMFFFQKRMKDFVDVITVYLILATNILACILMGIYWNKTIIINGKPVSLPFFLLVFILGVCECSTSVVYFPIISKYKNHYISALSVGVSLTGLIVGIFGFIQQPGRSGGPLFSVHGMMILIAATALLSGIGFSIIQFSKLGNQELRSNSEVHMTGATTCLERLSDEEYPKLQTHPPERWKALDTIRLVLLQGLISSAEDGILISVAPYVLEPYGNQVLSIAMLSSMIVEPIAAFSAYIIPFYSCVLCNSIWISLDALQLTFALIGPPNTNSTITGVVMGFVYISGMAMSTYSKTKELIIAHAKLERVEKTTRQKYFLNISPFRKGM